MSKILIYTGELEVALFSNVKAMLSFSESTPELGISNIKYFDELQARKGLEQLKRWVSTGAFKAVILNDFLNALEKGNSEHIKEWLVDHSSEPDFPYLILIGDRDFSALEGISKIVSSAEELKIS